MKTTICHFETHLHKLRHYWKSGVSLLGLSLLLLSYVDGFAQSVEAIHIFQGHSDSVESVAFSPDGNKALSGSYDRTMKLWNVETGTLEETFQEHTDFIMSVAFASDDGSDVLSGSADGTLYWRNGNKTITFALEEPIGLVHSIAFSPDGNYALLSGSRHNTTKLWDIKTGLESVTPPTHQAWVHLVAFSPDGNKALSASDDGIIKVWNVKTGKLMHSFSNTDRIWAAAFVPNRNQLLFGGNDGSIRVLDVAGKEIRTLKGHTGRIYSVAVADSQVLSGGHDGSMKLWNLDTGQELSSFQGHSDIVSSIAFSPTNSNYALSGSYDKTLKLWGIFDVSTGFQGLKESYLVGDQIVVDLVETGQRSEQIDIWVAIRLHTGELIFRTPSSSAQAPFKTSVDSSETTHRVLDIEVTPVIVGKYTLYALYVEKGKNPLEDGLKVRRSNLLVQEVILDKVK